MGNRNVNVHIGESFVVLMIQFQDFVEELVSSVFLCSFSAFSKKCSLKNTFSIHTPIYPTEEFEIVHSRICLQIFSLFL